MSIFETHRERELTFPELEDLQALIQAAAEATGQTEQAAPDEVVQSISDAVATIRRSMSDRQQAFEASIPYGALWGDQVRRALGWEWVWLTEVEDEQYQYYAVTSPNREYFVAPLFLHGPFAMGDAEEDTSVLLFNLLRTGHIPRTGPRAYYELS
jgi:hypothetical protein